MIEITLAYILDLIFGDPRWLLHPVKGIGWAIRRLEFILRHRGIPPFSKGGLGGIKNERIAGMVLAVSVIGIVWVLSFILIWQVTFFNGYLGAAVSIFFIYTSLSIKDLRVESMRVCHALENGDLDLARRNLSMIVGRDTANLDKQGIIRAAVETVSENIVDGIISPLFYAFIGAAPLALAYKAVNTLDSMVGYKNEKYKDFGWASAKLDDLVNFIPSRLSGIFLPIASFLLGKNCLNSLKITLRDSRKNPSPNSGIPQAAVAGALGIQLGGVSYYNAAAYSKPLIGDRSNALETGHIKESLNMAYICSLFAVVSGIVLLACIVRMI